MPHIIVEYSSNMPDLDVNALLEALHATLGLQEGVDPARIKTRAHKLDHFLVGKDETEGKMAHVTLLILEGRDLVLKQQFGKALYETLIASTPDDCTVTLEIRDMVKQTYYA